jgi:hypothetical protein
MSRERSHDIHLIIRASWQSRPAPSKRRVIAETEASYLAIGYQQVIEMILALLLKVLPLLLSTLEATSAFQSMATVSNKMLPSKHTVLFANPSGASEESNAGGLLSMKSLQSQLASAFTALDERDQYDAVLTGLCAKILDTPKGTPEDPTAQTLRDPMQLVEEMNTRRIKASPRSLMAFIDVRKCPQSVFPRFSSVLF